MKIHLDVDVTPEELRTFMGLPNVAPLQEEMLEQIRDKMMSGMDGFDALSLMKPYMPESIQSLTGMQKAVWQTMMSAVNPSSKKADAENSDS